MTRIIHIISDSNIGGAGRCLVNYLRCHDRSRFDVSVILPRGSLLIPEVAALNVPYFEVDGIAERSFSPEAVGTLFALLLGLITGATMSSDAAASAVNDVFAAFDRLVESEG